MINPGILTYSRRTMLFGLLAATAMTVAVFVSWPSVALGQSPDRAPVQGVTVSAGDAAGELRITWDASSPTPNDYRVIWALRNGSFPSWRDPDGNAYPTESELTLTGLEAGAEYKIRVRARFGRGDSSPWSEVVYGTTADVPPPQITAIPEQTLVAAQQLGHTSPTTMAECSALMRSGEAVYCTSNRFSVDTYYPDNSFSINWSVWASDHDNITHYTVRHREFQYRNRFKRADTQAAFNVDPAEGDGWVVPGSCEAAVLSTDSMGQATEYFWRCQSLTNVNVDTDGNPTTVETDAENWTQASWDGSLASPSRKHDVPVTAMRI
ncbi:MAG: fibronectin type III domain-containing protein, partial [Chloroflexota bacterium]|nr:fibronectin type III domain-containing protein [Chloroflexota bacterium]